MTSQYGPYPHTDDGDKVRRGEHKLRSLAIENFNEHFKGIFSAHAQVPNKGWTNTRRFALGAIWVYQLAWLIRFQQGLPLRVGLKAFIKLKCKGDFAGVFVPIEALGTDRIAVTVIM